MKKDKVLVGQIRDTNEGGSFTVVEVISAKEIYIVHNDEHKHRAKVSADQVRNGNIRNPSTRHCMGLDTWESANIRLRLQEKVYNTTVCGQGQYVDVIALLD